MSEHDMPEGDYQTLLGKYRCAAANAEMFERNNELLRREIGQLRYDVKYARETQRVLVDQMCVLARLHLRSMKAIAKALGYDCVQSLIDDTEDCHL
jgi:hypothetical protein